MGCFDEIKKAFSTANEDDIRRIITDIDEASKFRQKKLGNTKALAEHIDDVARERIMELKRNATQAKRRTYINVLKKKERSKTISTFKDSFKGIEATLVGTPENLKHAQESVEALSKSIQAKVL